jgi:hypothetical protein
LRSRAKAALLFSGGLASAAAGAWVVDFAACALLKRDVPWHPHFHSWWHIGTAAALWYGFCTLELVIRDVMKREKQE